MRLITRLRAFSHTLQTKIEANLYKRKQELQTLKNGQGSTEVLKGHFDTLGSKAFTQKHSSFQYKLLNLSQQLRVSPIGVGTYKGSFDQTDDLPMFNGVIDSVMLGCNMIDSCRNFRKGLSEKVIGLALRNLCQKQGYTRNNLMINSKAGYVFEDLPQGVTSADVVNDHCIHPKFLKDQIDKSLISLGLQTIDVYYLNNASECQMKTLGKQVFEDKLAKAFQTLEQARSKGLIKHYGLSSWQSFRVGQNNPDHLSLHTLQRIAQKVAGKSHGLNFVQLPINIMMPEAFSDKYIGQQSFLQVAQDLKFNVVSSSPLLSGSLINIPMPADLLKCNYNGAKHLQLIRSIPSPALVCTLIGHKLNRHVRKNLQVLFTPRLNEDEWLNVFVPQAEPSPMSA